ncbi:MAG TPA: hypothetical protein VEU54_03530 [Steroidobacteraceae bacterium]|jgi:hypothetical protein|nr:hypothetical protein [Steroidobacteraceae bacterium]
MKLCTLVLLATSAALGTPALLPAAEEPSFGKDLTATIVLHGLPCDAVVDAKRNGDSDYTATCKNGNRYHVFVDSSGRVVVQKL